MREFPMTGVRQNRRFLLTALLTFVGLAVASFIVFDRVLVLPARDPPLSFREMLFERADGPRIVVDAGSNAYVGFDPEIFEERFGRQTVLIADHAGYPLAAKLDRLEKYARPGDIVILPLEWNYYVGQYTDVVFTNNIFTYLKHYYRAMPFLNQVLFFFESMRLSSIARYVQALYQGQALRPDPQTTISGWYALLEQFPHGAALLEGPVPLNMSGLDCRGLLLYGQETGALDLDRLAERLARLARERQVKIALTWPVVVGHDCYRDYDRDFLPIEKAVRAAMGRVGIPIIGNPRDYHLDDDTLLLDTYYHPTVKGARIRTRLLADQLAAAGILQPAEVPPSELNRQREAVIDREILTLARGRRVPVASGTHVIDELTAKQSMLFGRGWSGRQSNNFIWSTGPESVILIRLPEANCRLKLNHMLYGPQTESLANLNGGPAWQSASEPIVVPASAKGVAVVRLRHRDVVSPAVHEGSTDTRPLKFGLESFTVDCD